MPATAPPQQPTAPPPANPQAPPANPQAPPANPQAPPAYPQPPPAYPQAPPAYPQPPPTYPQPPPTYPQPPPTYPQPPPAYPQPPPTYPQPPPTYPQPPSPAGYSYSVAAPPYGQGGYPVRPAYAYPLAAGYYAAEQVPHKTGHSNMWALVVAGVIAFMVVLGSVSYLAGPTRNRPGQCSASTCPKPPRQAPALGAPHVYVSTKYGYQVAFYDHPAYGDRLRIAIQDDRQIGWAITSSSTGLTYPITIAGQDAGSSTPDSIVDSIQQSKFPDARKVYAIPGLQLGYTNGSGNVYDINIKSGTGSSVHGRLIVATAIKNGVAITVVVVGPYVKTTPSDGHPNPAETPIAGVADDLVSNITFKGDTPL